MSVMDVEMGHKATQPLVESAEALTIAVIGHGKSPEGKRWGEKIDACDFVIRMWNWHWQTPEDYGTKYDYGLLEKLPQILRKFYEHNEREPTHGFVVSQFDKWVELPLPPHSIQVSQKPWNELGMELGGLGATGNLQFTRGTVAACWAIEHAKVGDKIILVGFDNVYCGTALSIKDGFATAWQTDPTNYYNGYMVGRKYGNHDFWVENPVMQRLAAKRGVTVQFSQDVWAG